MEELKTIIADGKSEFDFLSNLRVRSSEVDANATKIVTEIINDIKINGDSALLDYCRKFDKTDRVIELTKEDFFVAYKNADKEFISALEAAAKNIRSFHTPQKRAGYELKRGSSILGEIIRPLEKVGIYVPGGTAAYPSSVLMNAIPAKIAGVSEVIMVTPPTKGGKANPDILASAYIAGVDRAFLIGGAQAIAALSYGTNIVHKVDKIVGPGNIYVATAKRLIYGQSDIDMIAGPSEITIIADESARADFIAADMLSQAEHDTNASAILITTCTSLANDVKKEIALQLAKLERSVIARKSLCDFGGIIIAKDISNAIEIANIIAPEHLEIMTSEPYSLLDKIKNAGSVFLGEYSPEPLGDYLAGTNHVLPTSGTARFFSPLSVDSFVKKIQYISYSKADMLECADKIIKIADREGLTAHANSARIRKEDKND